MIRKSIFFVLCTAMACMSLAENVPSTRFKDTGDGTVSDQVLKIRWIKAPHTLAVNHDKVDWNAATVFCEQLSYAGGTGWRLPTATEIQSLVNHAAEFDESIIKRWLGNTKTPFSGPRHSHYWTGTVIPDEKVWSIYLFDGYLYASGKQELRYVWPVRDSE